MTIVARRFLWLAILVPAWSFADEVATQVEPEAHTLGLFVGSGYLGSAAGHGAALMGGVRFTPGNHLALGFDLGYGFASGRVSVEDRWWLMPSVAFVLPLGRLGLELGLGAGLGTASGFSSWSAYTSDHTDWASQLVPAGRLHAGASFELSPRLSLFTRLDVATLWVEGNSIGVREGTPHANPAENLWVGLSLGVQFGVL